MVFGIRFFWIMRIVTHDALLRGIMLLRVDARNLCAGAVPVGKIGMATDTQIPPAIYVQAQRVFRMIIVWPMAILAAYRGMGRILKVVKLVFVAFCADLGSLVFYGILFPYVLVGFAVPAVHVAAFPDTEV